MKKVLSNMALFIMNYTLCIGFLSSCRNDNFTQLLEATYDKEALNTIINNTRTTRGFSASAIISTRYIMDLHEVDNHNIYPKQSFIEATDSFIAIPKDEAHNVHLHFAIYYIEYNKSKFYFTSAFTDAAEQINYKPTYYIIAADNCLKNQIPKLLR